MNRRSCSIAAVAAIAVLAAPAAALAKSYSVHEVGAGGQSGVQLHATYKGSPFGTCNMTGTLVIPNTKQTWKCRGGSFKLVGHGTTGASNNSKGTWKIVKGSGTGKFRHIAGSGTFSGQFSTGRYTYVGHASF
jgi:hypothetical protein